MKSKISVNVGSFIEVDFGKFSEAVDDLLKNGIREYSPGGRLNKYKMVKSVLLLKKDFVNFWIVFSVMLNENFDYDREVNKFFDYGNAEHLDEKELDHLKKIVSEKAVYECFVIEQFDLLNNHMYDKIINASLFEGVESLLL